MLAAMGARKAHDMTLRDFFRSALQDRGEAINLAMSLAEETLEHRPDDLRALAYKGSMLSMVGADVLSTGNKQRYVQSGCALMEQALQAARHSKMLNAAEELELRMVCALTLAQLPVRCERGADARNHVYQLIVHPGFDSLEEIFKVKALTIAAAYSSADGHEGISQSLMEQACTLDQDLARVSFKERQERFL